MQEEDGSLTLHLEMDKEYKVEKINADKILIAIGRPPKIDELHLENTSIHTKQGVVLVDEY
jgi:pyruvate/2-oxoglutarate dehydrogenase complex dihydrolipoamide dehydrogenase (E3) component